MFTNQTPNYGLPQYTSPDELNVLVDFNGAMSTIDTQMKSNELAAQDAKNTAVSASNKADANTLSIQTLNDIVSDPATGIGPRVTALEGHVNSIDSLIGNGTPTVGDDTLIGGINANATSIGDLTTLNTTVKTSVVAAINEVNSKPALALVATSTTGDKGTQIGSLLTAYQALSIERKLNAVITDGIGVFRVIHVGNGVFARSSTNDTSGVIDSLDLTNGRGFYGSLTTTGNTFSEYSSQSAADGLYSLYA